MTKIESTKVSLNQKDSVIFDYLSDMRNIEELLPRDKISEWKADEKSCSFKIQNAATIPLVQESLSPHSLIHIKSGEKSPFPFTLDVHIQKAEGTENTVAFLEFNGDINPFLKMMVQTPLTNLFNYMAERLQKVHNAS